MKRLLALTLTLALVLTLGQAFTATSTERIDVIIGFNNAPDAAVVTALGGEVTNEFTIIPAVSATIPEAAIKALENNPNIAYVEPDVEVRAMQTIPWGVSHINAPTVHGWGNKGTGIRVAVLDTGIDYNHPDLTTYGGWNYINNNSNYYDGNGHGTHVAGTVAALDNSIGVLGVAPEVRLYGVKVLGDDGGGTLTTVINGIQWSVNNNMHIINMSLGASSGSTSLQNACDAAWNAGLVLVAAAGNSGNWFGWGDTVGFPAKYSSVIAVAAVNSSNTRPSWSSHGPAVEIAAPGVSIPSTWPGGGYNTISGTSMACPHVAGVAALVWNRYPSWSNQQVRNRMNSTALYLGNTNYYGHGLVRANAAAQ